VEEVEEEEKEVLGASRALAFGFTGESFSLGGFC